MMFFTPRCSVAIVAALAGLFLTASSSQADIFTGTLFYTDYAGEPNVNKVAYAYNDQTHALAFGTQTAVASVNGADGIVFAPNGNLLVASNAISAVYRIDATTGAVLQAASTTNPNDYHLTLDPSGTKLYSSDMYSQSGGNLDTFNINSHIISNGSLSNATGTPITGDDKNVTQLAFAPNGKILYTDGLPNRLGSIGLFDLSNDTTTQLIGHNVVTASHGIVYDPYTGLWTMFGGGSVATMDPNAVSNAGIAASLKQYATGVGDFDQGAVDGFGHAFIAGSGGITFIDYSQSHDITNPNNFLRFTGGFGNIDDVAPLVGPGAGPSAVPEPSSMSLLGLGALGLLGYARRRRSANSRM